MLKMIVGIFLGLLIGAGCRWFDIPGRARQSSPALYS
jgi:hypothetical protein